MSRKFLLLIPLLFCLAALAHETLVPVAYAGFVDAQAAYDRGDYATAYKEFKALAEQGNAEAQNNLGIMYEYGRGVPEDDTEAAKWFLKAAEQGNRFAQLSLGIMYECGAGVPQDYVLAYMWLNLAAAQDSAGAEKERDSVAEKMTPAQIAEAQRLATEWKPEAQH